MKIIKVENGSRAKAVLVHALFGTEEFAQLQGALTSLCTISTESIFHPTTYTKTGARNKCAKYLLLPAALRKQLPLEKYDFDRMTCGTTHYFDSIYLIFKVPSMVQVPDR